MMNEVPTGTSAEIGGLAASDTTLYAANTARERIEVYDAESMQQKATWSVHEPGRLALSPDGTLWVLSGTRNDRAPKPSCERRHRQFGLLRERFHTDHYAAALTAFRSPLTLISSADNSDRTFRATS